MPIALFGCLEFFLVHTELKSGAGDGFGFRRYPDLHKTKGAPRLGFGSSQTHQQGIPWGQAMTHGPQGPEETGQTFASDGVLLRVSAVTPVQRAEFAVLLEQSHRHGLS